MLFAKIEDKIANIELLVFPSVLKETADLWREGEAVICRGRISDKDNELKVICEKVKKLNQEEAEKIAADFIKFNERNNGFNNNVYNGSGKDRAGKPTGIAGFSKKSAGEEFDQPLEIISGYFKIKIDNSRDQKTLNKIKEHLSASKGSSRVIFYIRNGSGFEVVETGFMVNDSQELRDRITELLGEGAVK